MRQESALADDSSFYDHVPYQQGPFSFTLYRDIADLKQMGYLDDNSLAISDNLRSDARLLFDSLPQSTRTEVGRTVERYAKLGEKPLIEYVYSEYPWFASRSRLRGAPTTGRIKGKLAVYTAGYEGESVDHFFQKLMRVGIEVLIDVRHNPVSRKYGFSKKDMQRLCQKLDIRYEHIPELGIPSSMRSTLSTYEDYKRLLNKYERSILPEASEPRARAAHIMESIPSVLVCFEKNVHFCHRGRLAKAIANDVGLEVKHL